MELIDLTHPINSNMPLYPGTEVPEFYKIASIREDRFRETKLNFTSHIGTHIDAPAHMIENGKFLGQFPVSKFSGKAFIISIPENTQIIDKEFLINFEKEIINSDFVLFKTGWSKYWLTDKYFKDFPILNSDATNYLVSFRLKGIGLDLSSVDPVETENWGNHYLLLENDLIIIENLCIPEGFTYTSGIFSCFPINYSEADGSPVRAVLEVL